MPPALSESEDSRSPTPNYDIPASIPQTQTKTDRETESLNVKAEEQIENELASAAEDKQMKKGKGSRKRKQDKIKPEEPAPTNGDVEVKDEEEAEEVFAVESIVDHLFKGKRCFYQVKWEGFPAEDNTWEPEENLLPASAEILGKYQKKIGGAPQPPKSVRKTASKATLKEQFTPTKHTRNDDDESGETPNKRSQRSNGKAPNVIEKGSEAWKNEGLSSYEPADKSNWEDLIDEVETVERDGNGTLYAFLRWRNGKRSKFAQNIYMARCPRAMLRFYEAHLSV